VNGSQVKVMVMQ